MRMLATRSGRAIVLLAVAAKAGWPALFSFHKEAANRPAAITLRKRLHVNTLITEPDTMDIEFGGAFSTDGSFTFPTTIRFTPEGPYAWWGRTEFSVAFDSINSTLEPPGRFTHFGDRTTLAATCVVHDGEKLDLAIAPQVSTLFRGDSGIRAGATPIARYDVGRSSAGVSFTWTGATESSATNPAGTMDIGAGYGWRMAPRGALGHLTPHVNWLWERSTGIARQISTFEGVEYQVTDPFAIDFSAQQIAVWGGPTDHQWVVGITVNTGRLSKREKPSKR